MGDYTTHTTTTTPWRVWPAASPHGIALSDIPLQGDAYLEFLEADAWADEWWKRYRRGEEPDNG